VEIDLLRKGSRIPLVLPVLPPDPDIPLDLSKALHTAYERAHYERRINYSEPPTPPLKQEEATWAWKLFSEC
jgi:hypothetical protein